MTEHHHGNPPVTQALHVPANASDRVLVHSWMRDGAMQSAWPGDSIPVPPDGAPIHVRIINFPIGSIREVYLDAGVRTHPHPSYEDVLFYQITGRRVQMCEQDTGLLNPGDVSFEPNGVDHSTHQLIGGLFVEFALPAPVRQDGRGEWLRADQAREIACATWIDAGAVQSAEGPDAFWAPDHAPRHTRRIFSFAGHDVIETVMPEGTYTAPRQECHDTLFYVVAGNGAVTIGDESHVLQTADSFRVPAAVRYAVQASGDLTFIQAAARPLA
ncbi:MAG: cupin domain-containing protein [Novosphingobium sp.]